MVVLIDIHMDNLLDSVHVPTRPTVDSNCDTLRVYIQIDERSYQMGDPGPTPGFQKDDRSVRRVKG